MSCHEGSPGLHPEEPLSVRSSLHISVGGREESSTRVPPISSEVEEGKETDEMQNESHRERNTDEKERGGLKLFGIVPDRGKQVDGYTRSPPVVSQGCHKQSHISPHVESRPHATVTPNYVTKFQQTLNIPSKGHNRLGRRNLTNPGRGDIEPLRGKSATQGTSRNHHSLPPKKRYIRTELDESFGCKKVKKTCKT